MAHEGQGYDIKGGLETRERRKEDHCDDDMSPRFSFLTLTLILPPPVVSCLFVMSVVTCFDQPDMESPGRKWRGKKDSEEVEKAIEDGGRSEEEVAEVS